MDKILKKLKDVVKEFGKINCKTKNCLECCLSNDNVDEDVCVTLVYLHKQFFADQGLKRNEEDT